MRMPVLFISHGSPMLALTPTPAQQFLRQLGARLAKPQAILLISAHYQCPALQLTASPQPATLYDFGGFPPELYQLQYPAPGSPQLAGQIASLLQSAGLSVSLNERRGLDHGAWVPLSLLYPQAQIPVVQLSLLTDPSPARHLQLGHALQALRDQGVLIIGSGSATHNLREVFQPSQAYFSAPDWVENFRAWLQHQVLNQDHAALLAYLDAPDALRNHPTNEHLLPLFVALGATEDLETAQLLHHSYEYGVLAMDCYGWGQFSAG